MSVTKDTVAWTIRVYDDYEGALSDEQIARLGAAYGLDLAALGRLSSGLTIALDPRRYLVREDMKPAQEKAARSKALAAAKDLENAERKLASARNLIENVRFKNPYAHAGVPNPAGAQLARYAEAVSTIASFRQFLETMGRNGLVTYGEIADKRRARDERRRIVCKFIFEFWEQQGRKLSYTTDPLTSQRGGPLTDFVNSVVECISDPPGQLGGEAIKFEIEAFKARKRVTSARR